MVIHALTPQFFTGCNFDLPLLDEQLEKVRYRWLLSKFHKMCSRFFPRLLQPSLFGKWQSLS